MAVSLRSARSLAKAVPSYKLEPKPDGSQVKHTEVALGERVVRVATARFIFRCPTAPPARAVIFPSLALVGEKLLYVHPLERFRLSVFGRELLDRRSESADILPAVLTDRAVGKNLDEQPEGLAVL